MPRPHAELATVGKNHKLIGERQESLCLAHDQGMRFHDALRADALGAEEEFGSIEIRLARMHRIDNARLAVEFAAGQRQMTVAVLIES